jgi:large subunit ribosomal protein L24
MSVAVSKQICQEYGVPRLTLPIRKDDTVRVICGKFKSEAPAKVTRIQRRKYRVFIDNIQREKANGAQVKVPIHFSNLVITKLKLDGFRHQLIKKKVQRKKLARRKLGLDIRQTQKADVKEQAEQTTAPDLD